MLASWIAPLLCAALAAGTASAGGIEGVWRTAAGTLEVEIEPCGAAFCGTVVKVLSTKSMSDPALEMGDEPALGLVVLSNFLPAGDGTWAGFIYDREAVQTYRCNLSLDASGRLIVHGYVGWPLIGSSQIWTRAG